MTARIGPAGGVPGLRVAGVRRDAEKAEGPRREWPGGDPLTARILLALALLAAPLLTAPAAADPCAAGAGRHAAFVATGGTACVHFYVNAGDEILITVLHAGGEAPVVAGELRNPSGAVVNGMQFFSTAGHRDVGWCTATTGGSYTLTLGAYNAPGGAWHEATVDTTTQTLVGNGPHAPAAELRPGDIALSALIFAGNAGMCISF